MAVTPLPGTRRERIGKGGARKARAAGQIPGVLYGHGEDPVPVAVNAREFDLVIRSQKSGNPIVNLNLGSGESTALIRDVQYDPITHDILHIDFQHISLTEEVDVEVAIHLLGTPVGVKDGGGILESSLRQVEVRCLPTNIPGSIDIDVSHLNIGESVHVSDLKVENAEILSDETSTIATVVPPTVTETAAEAEEAEEAEAEGEPEVIAKGKKDEEEEGAEKEGD